MLTYDIGIRKSWDLQIRKYFTKTFNNPSHVWNWQKYMTNKGWDVTMIKINKDESK